MNSTSDQQIIERVKVLRDKFAGPRGKSRFARALGISPSTYNYYENDRLPPIETLIKMAQVAGADLGWLLTGESNDNKPGLGPYRGLIEKIIALLEQNPELAQPLQAFVDLLEAQELIEKKTRSRPAKTNKMQPGWIPILGRTAAGIAYKWDETIKKQTPQAVTELRDIVKKHIGKDIVDSDSRNVQVDLKARPIVEGISNEDVSIVKVNGDENDQLFEFVDCKKIQEMFPDAFALHIDGNSMSPKINDGDVVIVSPSVSAVQGQIAVVKLKDQIGVTCKLFRKEDAKVHLIPINEMMEAKIYDENQLQWALAVICHVRCG